MDPPVSSFIFPTGMISVFRQIQWLSSTFRISSKHNPRLCVSLSLSLSLSRHRSVNQHIGPRNGDCPTAGLPFRGHLPGRGSSPAASWDPASSFFSVPIKRAPKNSSLFTDRHKNAKFNNLEINEFCDFPDLRWRPAIKLDSVGRFPPGNSCPSVFVAA